MDNELPIIILRNSKEGELKYHELIQCHPEILIVDEYAEALREVLLLNDPTLLRNPPKDLGSVYSNQDGRWVYFPWKNTIVHTLAEPDFTRVRLSRNRNIITDNEAKRLSDISVAVAGLNVGNPGAICLVQEGVGKRFSFADNDALGLSNFNRFRAGLPDLGVNKAILSARQAYEINPSVDIRVYKDGINPKNMGEFLEGADVLIEEMDALPLKIAIREEAKRRKIPVIMVTGNGHDLVLDVERYDMEPSLEILSGKLKQRVIEAIAVGPKSLDEKISLAQDFMGKEYLSQRLNESFPLVGKSLIGIPQIAEATFLRGAVLTHVIRSIILDDGRAVSGRYAFGLSDIFSKKI